MNIDDPTPTPQPTRTFHSSPPTAAPSPSLVTSAPDAGTSSVSPSPTTDEDSALSATNLTKRFGDLTALDDITLEIPRGGVIGFVGPNGSGKSTFIRTLLGLLSPTSGTGTVLGHPIDRPERFAHDVGALIENPAFVGSLTARDNLASLAALRGLPAGRIDDVLDIVGLTGRDRDKASTYSLGMKQRLGIAAALLPDPQLLLLDEPTNGLDPAGIVEIRALLRRLASEGRTVVVSSHLLGEIQAACDYVVMIRFGQLVYAGGLAELMHEAAEHVVVAPQHLDDLPRLTELYRDLGWIVEPNGSSLELSIPAHLAVDANVAALGAGINLQLVMPMHETLEDVFLRLTGGTDAELTTARRDQSRDRSAPHHPDHATTTDSSRAATPAPHTHDLVKDAT